MRYPEKLMEGGEGVALDAVKPPPAEVLSVVSHCLPSFYRYAYRLLGNKTDAEDAVQDALLAAYKHLNQFRGNAQLSTWLTTIVINCARMHLRKRSRYIHVSLDSRIGEDQEYPLSDILVDHRPSPEDECHRSTLNARLMKSAAQLSPTLRKTFHLRFVDHLSIGETARVLGVPTGTVKAQTTRARAKLLKAMRGLLRLSPAERNSCSPRRPHQNSPAVPTIKLRPRLFVPSQRRLLGGHNSLTHEERICHSAGEEQYGTAVFEDPYAKTWDLLQTKAES